MKKLVLLFAGLSLLLMGSCSKKVTSTTAYRTYETECLGADPSGAQVLKVWGSGKDYKEALENASKKAVEDVTFNHVTNGPGDCNSWPVIDSPVARRNNSAYFSEFFKHNGKYRKYVKAEKPDKDKAVYGNDRVVLPVVVTVDRQGLVEKFTDDKIIK